MEMQSECGVFEEHGEGWGDQGSGDGVGVPSQDEDEDHQKLSHLGPGRPVMKLRFSFGM